MLKIKVGNDIYNHYEYSSEDDFERRIVKESKNIFGNSSIYLDIKKKIGKTKGLKGLPDAWVIDLKSPSNPLLYIIENELSSHHIYTHISEQIGRFAAGFQEDKFKIKEIIVNALKVDPTNYETITNYIKGSKFDNIDELIEKIVYKSEFPSIIILIDNIKPELTKALNMYSFNIDILEFKTYKFEEKEVYLFEELNSEFSETLKTQKTNLKIDEIDTIVVPARKDGFEQVFIGHNCWYAIKMSSSMIEKIKYIAAYQVAPESAITHYAEIDHIEKYTDQNKHETDTWNYINQNKYILYFKGKAKQIGPLKLNKHNAPQGPQYANSNKLFEAKELSEVFL
tara:strand:- start:234 stop:1253 length:1020 start_codon:yes stop_codon:yes gene_type:complete